MLKIAVFVDGEDPGPIMASLQTAWLGHWGRYYPHLPAIRFGTPINLKEESRASAAPPRLAAIREIRNPDMYFFLEEPALELGGVEVTTHSPDGSNADKRYPYLWSSQQQRQSGFVVCPYSKARPGGQVNRLPHRHAQRNLLLAEEWDPTNLLSPLVQILPLRELQGATRLEASIAQHMWGLEELAAFFAHRMAQHVGTAADREKASQLQAGLRENLILFTRACLENTKRTEPDSLLIDGDRWIQVFNARPDTGHWERGEGQFDSIDGRLMFTLDGIARLEAQERPRRLEFWLPQMCSNHPWVDEQRRRDFGSKRLRNLLVVLADQLVVRFADNLEERDWRLLQDSPGAVLERLDWSPGVYRIQDQVSTADARKVAQEGLRNLHGQTLAQVEQHLIHPTLFFSTHRAYRKGWERSFAKDISALGTGDTVLVPRIPAHLLADVSGNARCTIIPAQDCTKSHLLALRQLHRRK